MLSQWNLLLKQLQVKTKKQHIRLWFEFYKICCSDSQYQHALKNCQQFYDNWGDVHDVKFDLWWSKHSNLFGIDRVTESNMISSDLDVLNLQIPLNQPITKIITETKKIVKQKQHEQALKLGISTEKIKSVIPNQNKYKFTGGVELRGNTLHETLTLFHYWLELGKPPININVINDIRNRLLSRKRSKWVPMFMIEPSPLDESNLVRQFRRRIKRAKEICLSVSRGEFPGDSTLN
jgi:hypothetical protein